MGELEIGKAIQIATEKELDLIEVSPNAKPPVTKIMSWSKFKYNYNKRRKESKKKAIEQKEMWFKTYIDTGDLDHKLKRVREFLEKKHPVKITIRAKGRPSRENMKNLMTKILEKLKDNIKEEEDSRPKFEGYNYSIIVRPVK